jgi:hypothetical protein
MWDARKLAALASVLAALIVVPAAHAQIPLPRLPTGLAPALQVRPAVIGYTGDGSGWLGGSDGHGHGRRNRFGHLHWTRWTPTAATGHGAVWIDDCTPDCAAGTFRAYAATVSVSRPRAGVFRRLTLRYRYHGKRVADRRGVVRQGRTWSYMIIGVLP